MTKDIWLCICASVFVCMYVCFLECVCVCVCVCMCVCAYVSECLRVRVFVCVCVCRHAGVCAVMSDAFYLHAERHVYRRRLHLVIATHEM